MQSFNRTGQLRSVLIVMLLITFVDIVSARDRITIGSKPFTESYVLAELMAQLVERETDIEVDRRFGMQGTFTSFSAIREGSIDLYPEYTGTGAIAILKSNNPADQSLDSLRAKFKRLYGLDWLEPFGFNNAWVIVVKADYASQYELTTLSQLAHIPVSRAAFTHEFMRRDDGYPGLVAAYNMNFAEVRGIQHILAYDALLAGDIDVMDAYATDGELARYSLVILEDDLNFFPEYLAAPLIRIETIKRFPQLSKALNRFAGAISNADMQALNQAAAEAGESYPSVVGRFINGRLGNSTGETTIGPSPVELLLSRTARHLMLTAVAVILGTIIAVPMGIAMVGRPRLASLLMGFVGIIQTIPSIAMLGFMIPILGIGIRPAIAALFVYSLLPIVRNTYTGLRDIPAELIEVADGLGLSAKRRLWWLELPLAMPVIFAGIRTASVIAIGTATLAAFIGAGGLGDPIVQGLSFNDPKMILSGAVPAAVLAIMVDLLWGAIERSFKHHR